MPAKALQSVRSYISNFSSSIAVTRLTK